MIGYAMCGSFCTHSKSLQALGSIVGDGWDVLPVMSECVWDTDTRFGTSEELKKRVTALAGREIIHTIKEAERLGPEIALEYMIIAPCTGNTLAKLACGITDTAVCMAAKAHMRAERPLLIALASNDAISANLGNIGRLLMRKNVFFVPMRQDAPIEKPFSLVADFSLVGRSFAAMREGKQLRPLFNGQAGLFGV